MAEFTQRIQSDRIELILKNLITPANNHIDKKLDIFSNLFTNPKKNKITTSLDMYPTVLLYGPPNTGKTTLVYRLFSRLKKDNKNIDLFKLDFSLLTSSNYGETSKNIVGIFEKLVQNKNSHLSILIIDEIDQFCMTREKSNEHDASRRAMSALMLELDKLHPSLVSNLLIFGITNIEKKLDPAVVRRFSLKIKVNQILALSDFSDYVKKLLSNISETNTIDATKIDAWFKNYTQKKYTISDIKVVISNSFIESETTGEDLVDTITSNFETGYSSVEGFL